MSRQPQLTQWRSELATRFPDLSAPVVAVLALYSFGVLLAQVSGLASVVLLLTEHLAGSYHALRKRLREFYLDAPDKSGVHQGQKRRDFAVADCFAPLLRWLLSLWAGRHLPLALDVTNLADRFHVLCVSVLVRGLAIPVAWKVLHAGVKDPWNPHWRALLQQLHKAVPAAWTVVVLSDRGLASSELFQTITGLGWHPLMRVNRGGQFRPQGWGQFHALDRLAPAPGGSLALEGTAYSGARLACTLLARHEAGYAEAWLLLTDLPPEAGQAVWYGLRAWIEQGFKVIKGGGWAWDQTRMEEPPRVERLWLVLAVATLWVVALGAEAEAEQAQREERRRWERELAEAEQQAAARRQAEAQRRQRQQEGQQARRQRLQGQRAARLAGQRRGGQARQSRSGATARQRAHRVSKRGLAVLRGLWARGSNRLPQHLYPEPWPTSTHTVVTLNEQDFLPHQT
jgi:hypothetical protein